MQFDGVFFSVMLSSDMYFGVISKKPLIYLKIVTCILFKNFHSFSSYMLGLCPFWISVVYAPR